MPELKAGIDAALHPESAAARGSLGAARGGGSRLAALVTTGRLLERFKAIVQRRQARLQRHQARIASDRQTGCRTAKKR